MITHEAEQQKDDEYFVAYIHNKGKGRLSLVRVVMEQVPKRFKTQQPNIVELQW